MEENETFYQILGIKRDATPQQVTEAFRRLARVTHPDRNPAPDANEKMARLSVAYQTLIDAEKRRNYDESLDAAFLAGIPGLTDELNRQTENRIHDIETHLRGVRKLILDLDKQLEKTRSERASLLELQRQIYLDQLHILEDSRKTMIKQLIRRAPGVSTVKEAVDEAVAEFKKGFNTTEDEVVTQFGVSKRDSRWAVILMMLFLLMGCATCCIVPFFLSSLFQ